MASLFCLTEKKLDNSKESFASLTDQLRSAFEREAATSNILRVMASSPSELQIVMDAIAENAARLCEADDVLVRQPTVSPTRPCPTSARFHIAAMRFLWTSAVGLGERF